MGATPKANRLRDTSEIFATDRLAYAPDLMDAEFLAGILKMKTDWVYAETRAKRIPHIRLGRYYRYRREAIAEWLRDLEEPT